MNGVWRIVIFFTLLQLLFFLALIKIPGLLPSPPAAEPPLPQTLPQPVSVAPDKPARSTSSASPVSALPDFTQLVSVSKPAVVNISTSRKLSRQNPLLPDGFALPEGEDENLWGELFKHFFDPQGRHHSQPEQDMSSLGSGFIVSADGYLVTNQHVISGADEIIVRLDDRREFIADIIGSDERSDIAVLKIDAEGLPTVKIGNSDVLKVGEWVLAIGSPFGFDHSVTAGIVSSKGRSLPSGQYVPFIQTDVAINPGNSGGPLFNLQGEVIGVNSRIFSQTGAFMGLSFAIPMDLVLDVVEQLKVKGSVSRGWLGVAFQEVSRELAESFQLEKPEGALVTRVLPDSPAEAGGIQQGDIILSFDQQTIKRSSDLPPLVGRVKAGDTANVEVLRDGQKKQLTIKIGELSDDNKRIGRLDETIPSLPSLDTRLGLVLKEPDARLRKEYNLSSGGVVIVETEPGPGTAAGLREGDVITSVNNQAVAGVKDFINKLDELKPGSSVALLIQRPSGPVYLPLRVPDDD